MLKRSYILSLFLLSLSHLQASDAKPTPKPAATERAVFAGGCFWCMETPFEDLPGVIAVISGYTGGHKPNPQYQEVSKGDTGHAEAVEVEYDPAKISYEKLLAVFWRQIDPTRDDGQFCDTGKQYRPAIFYVNEEQKQKAKASMDELAKKGPFKQKLLVEITASSPFYAAEAYHQDYAKKNPVRYQYYRYSCGRDQFLDRHWGKDRQKNPH